MGFKELKHFDFSFKSPLVIFVTFHKPHSISHHQWDYYNSKWNVPSQNKIQPKKLNKEEGIIWDRSQTKYILSHLDLFTTFLFPLRNLHRNASTLSHKHETQTYPLTITKFSKPNNNLSLWPLTKSLYYFIIFFNMAPTSFPTSFPLKFIAQWKKKAVLDGSSPTNTT